MEARLDEMRARSLEGRPARIDRELDEATRLQLGALGYLEES